MDSLCCLHSLSLFLSLSLSRTFCHIKFALVYARGAIIIRVFDESVTKMSRTANFARYSSKQPDRHIFTSQRLMSHALFSENCTYSSQADYVHTWKSINYFLLQFCEVSFTSDLRELKNRILHIEINLFFCNNMQLSRKFCANLDNDDQNAHLVTSTTLNCFTLFFAFPALHTI